MWFFNHGGTYLLDHEIIWILVTFANNRSIGMFEISVFCVKKNGGLLQPWISKNCKIYKLLFLGCKVVILFFFISSKLLTNLVEFPVRIWIKILMNFLSTKTQIWMNNQAKMPFLAEVTFMNHLALPNDYIVIQFWRQQ